MANQLYMISPYYDWTWVFDDESTGLVKEPFVAGMPEMLDHFVRDIPDAREGFRLTFSADPFPGHQEILYRVRGDAGGWWYRTESPEAEGWLCPALFRYFDEAPERIYIQADARESSAQDAANLPLSDEASEEITIQWCWSDFNDDWSDADDIPALDEEEGFDGCFPAEVVQLSTTRFRLAEPCSMSPFGPYGPMLTLGTVIEVVPLQDGTYAYGRRVVVPPIWSTTIGILSRELLAQQETRDLLNELSLAGAVWECTVGNLTIQMSQGGGGNNPPDRVKAVIRQLVNVIERDQQTPPTQRRTRPVEATRVDERSSCGPTIDLERLRANLVSPPSQSTPRGYIKGTNIPWAVVVLVLWLGGLAVSGLYHLLRSL